MAVKKRVLPGREKQGKMDLVFFILVLVLLAFGLIMLFSASYANAYYYKGNSFQYIGRQAVFAVIGVIAMLVISRIDYHFWRKFAPWIFLVALLLMIAVLFTKGDENGIKRWFYIGPFQFQPSEIMKFAIILLFSAMISTNYKKMSTFKNGVLPYILILGVVSFLMYKEPHLSGTILILGIGAVLMFVGGTKRVGSSCSAGSSRSFSPLRSLWARTTWATGSTTGCTRSAIR